MVLCLQNTVNAGIIAQLYRPAGRRYDALSVLLTAGPRATRFSRAPNPSGGNDALRVFPAAGARWEVG